MKSILEKTLLAFAGYAARALGVWAESGPDSIMVPGYRSNSDYTSLGSTRYVVVAHQAAYRSVLATDPGSSLILGVMQNNPRINGAASIKAAGPSKVVAGGALTAGVIFTTNASGRAAAVTSGGIAIGRILETAGADGDIVSALLFHPVRWAGAV